MAMTKEQIIEFVVGDKILAIEQATRAFVASLALDGDMHKLALAEMAYRMARKLDRDAGMATAAIAKELRETLSKIAGEQKNDEDPFWAHFGSMPAPVRDSTITR